MVLALPIPKSPYEIFGEAIGLSIFILLIVAIVLGAIVYPSEIAHIGSQVGNSFLNFLLAPANGIVLLIKSMFSDIKNAVGGFWSWLASKLVIQGTIMGAFL